MSINPSEIAPALICDLAIFSMAGRAAAWEPRDSYLVPPPPGAPYGRLAMIADPRLSPAMHLLYEARIIADSAARSGAFAALNSVVMFTVDLIRRGDADFDADPDLADCVREFFASIFRTEHRYAGARESDDIPAIVRTPRTRAYAPLDLLSDKLLLADANRPQDQEPQFPLFYRVMGGNGRIVDKSTNETRKAVEINRRTPVDARIRHADAGRFVATAMTLLAKQAASHLVQTEPYVTHARPSRNQAGTRGAA